MSNLDSWYRCLTQQSHSITLPEAASRSYPLWPDEDTIIVMAINDGEGLPYLQFGNARVTDASSDQILGRDPQGAVSLPPRAGEC
jgi:hypothetical protein